MVRDGDAVLKLLPQLSLLGERVGGEVGGQEEEGGGGGGLDRVGGGRGGRGGAILIGGRGYRRGSKCLDHISIKKPQKQARGLLLTLHHQAINSTQWVWPSVKPHPF